MFVELPYPLASGAKKAVNYGIAFNSNSMVAINRDIPGSKESALEREVAIMSQLPKHLHILRCKGVIEEDGKVCGWISPFFDEGNGVRVMRQVDPCMYSGIFLDMLSGLEHMHNHQISYNDLKLDNTLFRMIESESGKKFLHSVLADFDASCTFEALRSVKLVGSCLYISPELTLGDGNYAEKSDLYTLGKFMAFTLGFRMEKLFHLRYMGMNNLIFLTTLDESNPGYLIEELLERDPLLRPSIPEIRESISTTIFTDEVPWDTAHFEGVDGQKFEYAQLPCIAVC